MAYNIAAMALRDHQAWFELAFAVGQHRTESGLLGTRLRSTQRALRNGYQLPSVQPLMLQTMPAPPAHWLGTTFWMRLFIARSVLCDHRKVYG